MRVSRASYGALLKLEAITRDTLRLLDRRSGADLQANAALQDAVRRQVRLLTETADRIRASDETLIEAHADDIARLARAPLDWDALSEAMPRIHAGVRATLRDADPPRWTTLGLRHRRRRTLGREGRNG